MLTTRLRLICGICFLFSGSVQAATLSEQWEVVKNSWLAAEMRVNCSASIFKIEKPFRGEVRAHWLDKDGNWFQLKVIRITDEAITFEGLSYRAGLVRYQLMNADTHLNTVFAALAGNGPGKLLIVNGQKYEVPEGLEAAAVDDARKKQVGSSIILVTKFPPGYRAPDAEELSKLTNEHPPRFQMLRVTDEATAGISALNFANKTMVTTTDHPIPVTVWVGEKPVRTFPVVVAPPTELGNVRCELDDAKR